jgi:hypothetical protein
VVIGPPASSARGGAFNLEKINLDVPKKNLLVRPSDTKVGVALNSENPNTWNSFFFKFFAGNRPLSSFLAYKFVELEPEKGCLSLSFFLKNLLQKTSHRD